MSEAMLSMSLNVFILLTLVIIQLLLPNITRKNILLGIKIPENQINNIRVKEHIKRYRIETIFVGLILLAISFVLSYRIFGEKLVIILVLLDFLLLFLVYLRWNRKVRFLKSEMRWDTLTTNTIAIDTRFNKEKVKRNMISKKWFLIPLGLVLMNFILTLYRYSSLPEQIPVHWDIAGNADDWVNKSIATALFMPFTQLFLTLIMFGSYYLMMKLKRTVHTKNPEISIKKNIKYRRIWGIYFLASSILLVLQFTYMNFVTLGIMENIRIFNYSTIIISSAMVISAIVISIKVGQGGERLKLEEEQLDNKYDIEDDRYWKLGNTIYYNKDDPSLFVEKRVGVGLTVNAGKLIGKIIIILPFLILIWVFWI